MLKTATLPVEKLTLGDQPFSLDDSRYTVLYFYPEDDTPGCTVEANEFQQLKSSFDRAGIRIVGVSVDGDSSHRAFCEKFALAFELATDPGGILGRELGILKLLGNRHKRVTFVVDRDGKVVLEYPEVKAMGHARQILEDIARVRD